MKIKESLVSYIRWAKRQSWSTFHMGVIAPICMIAYVTLVLLYVPETSKENFNRHVIIVGAAIAMNAIFCLRTVASDRTALISGSIGVWIAITGILLSLAH